LKGKESRKEKPSKEGLLGVEGLDNQLIIDAVKNSNATVIGEENTHITVKGEITKSDFYDLGLTGTDNSKEKRTKVLKYLKLPTYLSTNAMISALNILLTKGELEKILEKIK
jgi:ribonuclease M5